MRTFEELNDAEKDTAIGRVYQVVLEDVTTGAVEPLDDDVLSAIRLAFAKADQKQTPWFASAYLEDDPVITDWMWDMAGSIAEDAYFIPDDGGLVVRL